MRTSHQRILSQRWRTRRRRCRHMLDQKEPQPTIFRFNKWMVTSSLHSPHPPHTLSPLSPPSTPSHPSPRPSPIPSLPLPLHPTSSSSLPSPWPPPSHSLSPPPSPSPSPTLSHSPSSPSKGFSPPTQCFIPTPSPLTHSLSPHSPSPPSPRAEPLCAHFRAPSSCAPCRALSHALMRPCSADQSAATVSTPLESASAFLEANDSATSAAGDVEIPWPSPPELPQMHAHGSVVLRIRLPSGEFAVYISSVRSAVAIGFATDFKCCSLVPHVKLYSASLNRRREFHEGILVRALPRRCLQLHTPLLRGQAFHAAKV